MANKALEKLKVEKLTKYGFQIPGGEYVNWGQKLAESERGKVVPGGEYEFELFIADSGKKYVNAVVGQLKAAAPAPATKKTAAEPKGETMTRSDWDAKDVRISRQGVIQAAILATGGNFDIASELAEKMLKFVNQGK